MRKELAIPQFLERARTGEKITIHGDGLQFRNYVYVEDLAEAHVLALGDEAAGQVFNLEGPGAGEHPPRRRTGLRAGRPPDRD